jgi:PGF-pre-PGF domain-containing protein
MRLTDTLRNVKITIMIVMLIMMAGLVSAIGIGTFSNEFRYTPDQVSSITYLIIKEPEERFTATLDFTGNLSPYLEFNIPNYWYSQREDVEVFWLERDVNLSGVASATLTFYTKYDIEYGWDFGYVEVSNNSGASWTQLAGTGTTTYRDGGAYVGHPGSPAYTGSVGSWTLETVDLTPYAGDDILLRFKYVPDDYYAEHGWKIDDISIAEIGFSDDVQTLDRDWRTNGWKRNVLELDNDSRIIPVRLDFIIPDSYVHNSSDEYFTVSTIPGLDAAFNPTHSSEATIVTRFPAVVKVPLPTPTPPGIGGGAGTVASKERYSFHEGILEYFVDLIRPHKEHRIDVEESGTAVGRISLNLSVLTLRPYLRLSPLEKDSHLIRQPLDDVFEYFEVDTLNLEDAILDGVRFRISVTRTWVHYRERSPEDIIVSRWHAGRWEDLDTEHVDSDSAVYIYDVDSPGFSIFAIRLRSPPPEPMIIKPVPTEKPRITEVPKPIIIPVNESPEEYIEELKTQLRKKVAPPLPTAEIQAPKRTRPLWNTLLLITLIIAAIAGMIMKLRYEKRTNQRR